MQPCWGQNPLPCTRLWSAAGISLTTAFTRNPISPKWWRNEIMTSYACIGLYAVKAQTSLAPLSWFHGSRVTTAHVHQCCIFQSYAKTVPSRMKLTMCEPASMTTGTWSRRVTSDFNSVFSEGYHTTTGAGGGGGLWAPPFTRHGANFSVWIRCPRAL